MGHIEKQCGSPDSLCWLGWVDEKAARHCSGSPLAGPESFLRYSLVWCPQLSPHESLQGPGFGVGGLQLAPWAGLGLCSQGGSIPFEKSAVSNSICFSSIVSHSRHLSHVFLP